MTLDLTKPATGQPKKPSEIRENMQHLLGAALPDCILPDGEGRFGGKFTPDNGLSVKYSGFRGIIGGKYHEAPAGAVAGLAPRKAQLLYARRNVNTESLEPAIGIVEAVFPEADAGTVCRWIIDGSATIASTVGSNNLTKSGTVTQVDGWIGYGGKGDGSTGYYTSANSIDFPIAGQEKEIDIKFTPKTLSGTKVIANYGGSSITLLTIYTIGTRLHLSDGNTAVDTGFDFESGKTYSLSVLGNTSNIYYVYINGSLVYTSTAYFTGLNAGVLVLGKAAFSSNYYNDCAIHYIEIRNKMRTPAQIAAISNALLLPCRYDAPAAAYPIISASDLATAYHEWKFDETSGTGVADSAGTLNGTTTGTTIIDSELGLSKARKLNGTSSDYITCGNIAFGATFTVLGVVRVNALSGTNTCLLSNRVGSTGNMFYIQTASGKLALDNGTTAAVSSGLVFPLGTPTFFAYRSNGGGTVDTFINSATIDATLSITSSTSSLALLIGKDAAGGYYPNAAYDYLLIIPRALSQWEIDQVYKMLMKIGTYDIRTVLPTATISLGFVRTNSSGVIEIDDASYKYGRREGAIGGNRKLFLGWKYFNTGAVNVVRWDNPFGTRKVKVYYVYAEDGNGRNECDIAVDSFSSSTLTGYPLCEPAYRLAFRTGNQGLAIYNGGAAWKTSGYIGCYAEVIE